MRLGVAVARFAAAGLSERTTGRELMTKGRIWLAMIGVDLAAKGAIAALAPGSAWAAGMRSFEVVPSTPAKVCTLPSVEVVCVSAPGSSATAVWMLPLSMAKAWKTCWEADTSEEISGPRWASAWLSRLSEVTRRARFWWRVASDPLIVSRSCVVGRNFCSTACRACPLLYRPWPAPPMSSSMYSRVSASSEERISSGLTSGRVFCTGMMKPGLATGAAFVPGLSSMNMSFSPVRGRSSAVASVWMRCLKVGWMPIVTRATPLTSCTALIIPTCTPETRTDWPCPGVTAWAVEKSAYIFTGLGERSGNCRRSWERM